MTSSLSQSVRDHASAFVAGERSLEDFKDWLVGATWNVDRDHPDATDLTYGIKLLLAEHSSGDLSDADLRMELRQLVAVPASIAS